jgi:DNA polymerase IV
LVRTRGITLVGVALTGLESDEAVQQTLALDRASGAVVERPGLDAATDLLAERFGSRVLTRASLLRRGEGIEAPLLPGL